MTVATIVEPVVRATLRGQIPITVRCWDGSEFGPSDAALRVTVKTRRAIRRLLWAPNELGLARAYVSGDIDVEGDLFEGFDALRLILLPTQCGGVVLDGQIRKEIVKAALRLGIVGLPPKPPEEEARLRGHRHTEHRDAAAIAHHYNVGNDFYRMVLGESMAYSCAYWAEQPTPTDGLFRAQVGKCDLVAASSACARAYGFLTSAAVGARLPCTRRAPTVLMSLA
jgi:cyclopropane-fatty-acyl-phospholipid synthase